MVGGNYFATAILHYLRTLEHIYTKILPQMFMKSIGLNKMEKVSTTCYKNGESDYDDGFDDCDTALGSAKRGRKKTHNNKTEALEVGRA